jgi:uncharacterized protein (TIGR00255 family)
MNLSMTGFSAVTLALENHAVALELRSVNNRYLDIQFRLPDELRALEPALRELISAQVTRGKIECRISINAVAAGHSSAKINHTVLQQLASWSDEIRAALPDAQALSIADVLHWHGILESNTPVPSALHDALLDLLQKALADFNASRAREGEKLKQFLLQRTRQIDTLRQNVAPRIPAAIAVYEEKLFARLKDALKDFDEERVRQEIALFANRIDVDEELSRLHTHLAEVERILDKGGSVGKRLDFLMQELHREANTLGSKSADAEVSRTSLEMKVLVEQMREQIQNLE